MTLARHAAPAASSSPSCATRCIIAVLVAIPTALLSCFLVLKGWSLMGDAISHAVLPGVVLAYIVGLPLAVGAFAAGMVCALATGFLKENSRIKQDTVMGVVFSGMFGLGLVLYTKIQTDVHLDHILFGDMLGVGWRDIVETGIIAAVGGRRSWSSNGGTSCCTPSTRRRRRAIGLPVRLLHYGLLCDPVADHRRRAEGGRHHPRHRHADRARAPSPSCSPRDFERDAGRRRHRRGASRRSSASI